MKTTVFQLSKPNYELVQKPFDIYDVVFQVPILPAYSILHYSLDYRSSAYEEGFTRYHSEIEGDRLRIRSVKPLFLSDDTAALTIYYSGIRDYRLYFPHIVNKQVCERLADFAEEAEKCFESGAWMSFVVMVSSLAEGLLFEKYGQNKLYKHINLAKNDAIITNDEAELLHEARKLRNRVHAGEFAQPFPDRKIGNDLYVVYDKLIKKSWVL